MYVSLKLKSILMNHEHNYKRSLQWFFFIIPWFILRTKMTKKITLITFFRMIFVLRVIYEAGNQIKRGVLALDQSYQGVPGERFLGPIVRVVGTVGQQQCVRECRDRPKLCLGVSYRKQDLLCELVSDTEKVEPNSDYVRFELDQVRFSSSNNSSYYLFYLVSLSKLFCM